MAEVVRTTCPYCGVGCGVLASRDVDGSVRVEGDPLHPANRGRLCVKGAALAETVGLEGRLLHPQIGGRRVSWDEALDAVAQGFRSAMENYGPDSVAFYVSGQLLTEDYYLANKLMKGFIGSANIDTNSRLCMSSTVAGHTRAFGADTVPGCYEDLELADMVVLVGSNLAWCHPVLHQRLMAAKEARGTKVVVIDPRRTATAEGADLHLAIAPGSDVALFNALAANDPQAAWRACGLPPVLVKRFFQWWAETEKTVTVWSQGVNQSVQGTDKVNAIINLHLASGRIGRPGMGPFSVTGQPNAMGGREVGGLASVLAAHMGFERENVERVGRFWDAPAMAAKPGLKAVDLFRAVNEGRIKALWIMATNPAVSLPEAGLVRRALAKCPLVVVSDCEAETDTLRAAHIRLPALGWGEKDGTVTNSERRISRQRAFLPPPGEAKPDWWIVSQVAGRLGFAEAFSHRGPAEVFAEHCRLTAFENDGSRTLDLGGLAEADYDALEPIQWPVRRPGEGTARLCPDARMVPVTPRTPAALADEGFPLLLNTGRSRDQWHTMTRTGRAPRLAAHAPEPTLALHPSDAAALDVAAGDVVRVESTRGAALLRAVLSEGQRPGEVFAPIHWTDRTAAEAVVGRLIGAATDPVSGQPELKHMPVRVARLGMTWQAILFTRQPMEPPRDFYWSRARGKGHYAYRMAGAKPLADWPGLARQWLGGEGEWIELSDPGRVHYRAARLVGGRLDAALFVQPWSEEFSAQWVAAAFDRSAIDAADRVDLLAGSVKGRKAEGGPVVCACFSVGLDAIRAAIDEGGCASVAEIGKALRAGTGCGSCVPELKAILAQGERAA